jgi:hypothetical protein
MRLALLHSTVALCISLPVLAESQTAKAEPSVTTIVGCLIQGNQTGADSERTSEGGAASADDFFILTPAISLPPGGTVAVSSSGGRATTSAGEPDETAMYRITGLDREQLRPHIGHRVELHGHLTEDPPSASGRTTTAKTTVDATGRATTRVESPTDIAGVLHATTIKMVSASCQ